MASLLLLQMAEDWMILVVPEDRDSLQLLAISSPEEPEISWEKNSWQERIPKYQTGVLSVTGIKPGTGSSAGLVTNHISRPIH